MASPTSSLASSSNLSSSPHSTSYSVSTAPSPCSPSILLNPLPPSNGAAPKPYKKKYTIFITHQPSAPPEHWKSPPQASVESRSRSSSVQAPANREGVIEDLANGDAGSEAGEEGAGFVQKGKLTFAPLPPGRKMFRSNSLSIGVAARARMLSSQGGASGAALPRYAGPQQWYQPGGTLPPDVYTYKDVQKGLGKMWNKVRRRSSSASVSSSSTSEAAGMEREGKGKGKEIEHIEECVEEDHEEDVEDALDDEEDEEEVRGRTMGLGLGGMEKGGVWEVDSISSVEEPSTPKQHEQVEVVDKGKARDLSDAL